MTTNRKKDNIISLGWRLVICPAAKAADPISWIVFIAFLIVFGCGVVFRISDSGPGSMHTVYMAHSSAVWFLAWALFVFATMGPIINLTLEQNEVPLAVLIGFGLFDLIVFIVISVLALTQDTSVAPATGLLAATAGAFMVGIGWLVQQQISARATRRAHTFNILMQSRLSSEFQRQIIERAKYYPSNTKVSEDDARLQSKAGLEAKKVELTTEFERAKERSLPEAISQLNDEYKAKIDIVEGKYVSLKSVVYLLNFYEFICAGIILRELDERMIKETLVDIAVGLYHDTANLRAMAKEKQPEVFCNLDKLVGDGWSKK